MTVRKHLKQLVRARMAKTGERYAAARRNVVREEARPPTDPASRWHFPGGVPATTALRVLLAHAGVRAPHAKQPFSEALLFGIAGGIGIGTFTFLYEKENFASFFVAGRHLWQDDLAYLKEACRRFGVKPIVRESGGAKAAATHLAEALADGPCVAWVDLAHLPHRGVPAKLSGGGYHVVTVYRLDGDSALIGDLTDEPVTIPLAALAESRARIKKQKNRLLSIPEAPPSPPLLQLVRDGLRACHQGLTKGKANFALKAIQTWADRMHGSKDPERWERVFAGPRLWSGLTSIHNYVEHYFTGGGLCRPLFADFLAEAADFLDRSRLRSLAERYADLGRGWSDLADAALPDAVPEMKAAKDLYARRSELIHAGAPADEVRGVWKQLGDLGDAARAKFPLSDADGVDLRADLQARLRSLYDGECAAAAELDEIILSL
jgi:hypothetical protein